MTEDRVWQPWSQPRKFSPHPPAILSGCDNTLAMHLVCDKLAYNIVEGRPVGKLVIARNIRAGPCSACNALHDQSQEKVIFQIHEGSGHGQHASWTPMRLGKERVDHCFDVSRCL